MVLRRIHRCSLGGVVPSNPHVLFRLGLLVDQLVVVNSVHSFAEAASHAEGVAAATLLCWHFMAGSPLLVSYLISKLLLFFQGNLLSKFVLLLL